MEHFSFRRFIVNVGKLSMSLIITTSSHCLPVKICANKIDLKSLKVLKFDGLHTPVIEVGADQTGGGGWRTHMY